VSEIDRFLKDTLGNATKLSVDYPEGGFLTVNTTGAFIKYNTGDCVWFDVRDGEYCVKRIDTFDELIIEC
jgi:hypothetical protein